MVQYWRSFEDLERFARDPEDSYFPAWRRFNRTIGTDGSVDIWHESCAVEAGRYEVIYNNMPPFGPAKATERVPATGRLETARRRMRRGENEPGVPTPSQPSRQRTTRFAEPPCARSLGNAPSTHSGE